MLLTGLLSKGRGKNRMAIQVMSENFIFISLHKPAEDKQSREALSFCLFSRDNLASTEELLYQLLLGDKEEEISWCFRKEEWGIPACREQMTASPRGGQEDCLMPQWKTAVLQHPLRPRLCRKAELPLLDHTNPKITCGEVPVLPSLHGRFIYS